MTDGLYICSQLSPKEALRIINEFGGWEEFQRIIIASLKKEKLIGVLIGLGGAAIIIALYLCVKNRRKIIEQIEEQKMKYMQTCGELQQNQKKCLNNDTQ